jgi:predicted ArsR family transcriptional regulator
MRGKPIAHQRAATLEVLGTHRTGLDRRAVAEAIGLSADRMRDVLHSLRNDGLIFVTAKGGIYGRWALTEHREAALAELALHRATPVKRAKRIGRPPKPHAPPACSVFHWRP